MRSFFAIFLLLHGAAHTIGFLSPWGLAPRAADGAPPPSLNALFGGRVLLNAAMSRGLGLLWLATALVFAVVALAWWRGAPWSSPALIGIVLLSLLLSIAWWPVAKYGVFINLGILAALGVSGYRQFSRDMTQARIAAASRALMAVTSMGPMQYAMQGSGDPVLVIHGTGGGWDQSSASSAPR